MKTLRLGFSLLLLSACTQSEKSPIAQKPVPKPVASPVTPAPPPPKRLFARKFVARIRSGPGLDKPQLGYLRAGTTLTSKSGVPTAGERCRKGWFEIAETGGFVCDGREVTAFEGDTLPDRQPTKADRDAPLPYRYAYSRGVGTPMYKRLPTEQEALFWEDGVLPPDAGAPPDPAAANAPQDGGVPEKTGPVTLADLQGERGGLVRRKLNAGFYFSLDREFETPTRRYWRTMSNGYIPHRRVQPVEGSMFQGVALAPPANDVAQASQARASAQTASMITAQPPPPVTAQATPPAPKAQDRASEPSSLRTLRLPIAFIASTKPVLAYQLNPKGLPAPAGELAYHEAFEIVGGQQLRNKSYLQRADGKLVRADDVTRVDPLTAIPKKIPEDARWLDVDLTHQTLVAYEGLRPVYATLVSTGRIRNERNPQLNSQTPAGLFRILSKHVTTTMDGDHAVFGAYSLEDVPWVQFFEGAFALHGAFWHDKFGRPASHGCINLAPRDAHWLFNWTSPEVPRAWHAAYPAKRGTGTWVHIHGDTPKG